MTATYSAYSVLIDLPARCANGESISLEAVEDQFFQRLKLGNGTYKTTSRNRLDDVDAAFISALTKAGAHPANFMDVAASSGVTTLSWMRALRSAGLSPQMTITDLTIIAYIVSPLAWFRALVDRKNIPFEFQIFGHTLRARIKKIDIVTGKWLLIMIARIFYRCLLAVKSHRPVGISDQDRHVQSIPLLAYGVRSCSDITYVEDDITVPNPPTLVGKFDAIRVANILHRRYFDEATIRKAIVTMRERLKGEGSWLIVCRTYDDGRNNAGIYRVERGRFVEKASVGSGSEIGHLVTAG